MIRFFALIALIPVLIACGRAPGKVGARGAEAPAEAASPAGKTGDGAETAAPAANEDIWRDFNPKLVFEGAREGEPRNIRWIRYQDTWRTERPVPIEGTREEGRIVPRPMFLNVAKTLASKEIRFLFYSYSWLGARDYPAPRRDQRLNADSDGVENAWSIPLLPMLPAGFHSIDPNAQLRVDLEIHFNDGTEKKVTLALEVLPAPPLLTAQLTFVGSEILPGAGARMIRYELANPTAQKLITWIAMPSRLSVRTSILHTHHASQGRVEGGQVVLSTAVDRLGSIVPFVPTELVIQRGDGREQAIPVVAGRFARVELGAGELLRLSVDATPAQEPRASEVPRCTLPGDVSRTFVEYVSRRVCQGSANSAGAQEPMAIQDCYTVRDAYSASPVEAWRVEERQIVGDSPVAFVSDPGVDRELFDSRLSDLGREIRIAPVAFARNGIGGSLTGSQPTLPEAPCQGVY